MERINSRLNRHDVVGLDTSVFIYHLEGNARYLPLTMQLLSLIEAGEKQGVTSVIALMELTVRPWQLGRPDVAREYETLLVHFPHMQVVDVTRDVARRAARLRAASRLRPADALLAATALVHGATAFVTNDLQLQRLTPEIDIVIMDDLL